MLEDFHASEGEKIEEKARCKIWYYDLLCRQTNRQAGRQADRQTDKLAGRQTDKQTNRQTDKEVNRHTDKQTVLFYKNVSNIHLAVREDRMPGGRHRHKSLTQDSKDKGKKRRSSKENSYSPNPSSSGSGPSSPRSPTDDIDVMGMLSKYAIQACHGP